MKHEDKKDEGFGRRDFLKSAVAGGAVAAAATAAVTAPQPAQAQGAAGAVGALFGFIAPPGEEVGADGSGGENLWLPCSGSRLSDETERTLRMNGREVFKFATRIMSSSAEAILETCGKTVADIDVYVPHQANVRIIDHAAEKLGIPEEKVIVNVDRYGNTSSGSIPLALGEAVADGRLRPGALVLMTGMGAGLTWGSALIEWTIGMNGATQ